MTAPYPGYPFGASATFSEAINPNSNLPPQVPWRVSQSEVPTVITGQRKLDGGIDGVDWSGIGEQVQLYVKGPRVLQMSPNNRYAGDEVDIQCDTGVSVFVTYDSPDAVIADVLMAQSGGTTWKALWTSVDLEGTPAKTGNLTGNVTGLRVDGTGKLAISKL